MLEFYEGRDKPYSLDRVNADFYDHNPEIDRSIVIYKDSPIGYIQIYPINEQTSALTEYMSKGNVFGMDQFIGEVHCWNKGIGTLLVTTMVQHLLKEKGANKIIMDPQVTNIRALRCYEKAGFKKIRKLLNFEFHEGAYRDCWLLEFNKNNE
ncbi:acetyltransferase [Virgibacillus salarius]|uniref:acetyltransferase n=1 Tax=Virgibacillus salarius TaxID=447199 RepID=UPI00215BEC33|nr:acetyltransferase [Priestia megaterium]